jgi:hypothetical protein
MACLAHDEESLVFAFGVGVGRGQSRSQRSDVLARCRSRCIVSTSFATNLGHVGEVLGQRIEHIYKRPLIFNLNVVLRLVETNDVELFSFQCKVLFCFCFCYDWIVIFIVILLVVC